MRIAIIGLGVLGASTARALARAGAQVTVFERTAPGAGTTGTSYGWINSHQKSPRSYHELNVAGMAEHEALGTYVPSGSLEWAADGPGRERLAANLARLRDYAYPLEQITRARAAELAPDLLIPPGVTDLVHYPAEGYAPPIALLARLWGEARDHGAELRCPAEVVAIEPAGNGAMVHAVEPAGNGALGHAVEPAGSGGGATVRRAGGEPERFDRVVLTVGRWTGRLTEAIEPAIPMIPPEDPASPGLLAYTAPLPVRVPFPVISPELNFRHDGGGRLVLHALDLNATATDGELSEPDDGYVPEMLRRLGGLVRGGEHARIEQVRLGLRSLPADGHTVAGPDASGGIYIIATHSGVTLGPLLGRLAAQEILHDRLAPELAGFRPARFAGATAFAPLRPARHAGDQ